MYLLLMNVGNNIYAVETKHILSIVPLQELKIIHSMPPYFAGLLNLGGKSIPVLDFCQLIDKRPTKNVFSSRIVLLQDPGSKSERVLGLLGENINDFIEVDSEEFTTTDFSVSSFPFQKQVLARDGKWIQYLDLKLFFSFLGPDDVAVSESTESVKQPCHVEEEQEKLSIFVFRLGMEWLALPTIYLKEVTERRPIHSIPHKASSLLKGIVNLNGELKLCVSLHELLQIDMPHDDKAECFSYQRNRMAAIVKEGELWVFPVDEIDGVYFADLTKMENIPVNLSKSSVHYIKGMIKLKNKGVGLIDDDLLFASLQRSIQ